MSAVTRSLLAICLTAALHAGFYIVYQQPDWSDKTIWRDQDGYQRLGWVLAKTGRFTRSLNPSAFIPEAVRTPGYPAFLALVYLLAGFSQVAVAVAQGLVFVGICLIVYLIGMEIADQRASILAAAATALFPPIPYFGALVLTEVWTTFLLTLSMWFCIRATRTKSPLDYILAGLGLGWTALSRPVFVLLPLFLVLVSLFLFWKSPGRGNALRGWALLLCAFCLALLPWLAYNFVYFRQVTIAAGGPLGRNVWEGSWSGVWPGRVQAMITRIAEEPTSSQELEAKLQRLAGQANRDPEPLLRYARQWRDIRRIGENPEFWEIPSSRIKLDKAYLRVGIENIRKDLIGYVYRRITRGLFILWAGEIPVRYSQINELPTIAIRIMWFLQAGLIGLGILGIGVLVRLGYPIKAYLIATPLVYITLIHLPLFSEARYALPGKPVLLILATIGGLQLANRLRSA